MNLRMTSPDGAATVHLVKAGYFLWVPAGGTHTLLNEGREKGILVELELK
jgi:mannose-6-phosphate isomerase-like protein (cupin superfamily)